MIVRFLLDFLLSSQLRSSDMKNGGESNHTGRGKEGEVAPSSVEARNHDTCRNKYSVNPESGLPTGVSTRRPTIAAVATQMIYLPNPLRIVKDFLILVVGPPLIWGFGACLIPLYTETSGFSMLNLTSSLFVCFCGTISSLPFHTMFKLYYPAVTWRRWGISTMAWNIVPLVLDLTTMALNMFPIPLRIVVASTMWWPSYTGAIYAQLRVIGAIDKGLKPLLTFVKFSSLLFSVDVYFIICGFYILAMSSFRGHPVLQMTVSVVFNAVSLVFKHMFSGMVPTLLPSSSSNGTSTLPVQDSSSGSLQSKNVAGSDTLIRLVVFFGFEVCQELFISVSFSNVNDYASAIFMVASELLPVAFFGVLMTETWFEIRKRHFDIRHRLSRCSLHEYRLMTVEFFALRLIAELCATVGFLIMAPIWRYGWNSEFFPMRSTCETEFLTSLGLVVFIAILLVLLGYLNSVWVWKQYGIPVGRVMAMHVRVNRDLLFSYLMLVFVFPCALLARQSNVLPLAVPEAYIADAGCSS